MLENSEIGLIRYLAVAELRKRYAGSLGGMVWAFISPILLLMALWLVFGLGLKVNLGGSNFLALLVPALAVWLAFSEALTTASRSITANPHLITKINFPFSVLPIASIASALIIHAVVMCFVVLLLIVIGTWPTLRTLAVIYYLIAFIAFTVPFAVLLSILNVIVRDTAEIVSTGVGLLFWATPIIWPLNLIPERWQFLMYFNPAAYLTDGYRRVLAHSGDSWINIPATLVFWAISAVLFFLAIYVYRRFRHVLSDFL